MYHVEAITIQILEEAESVYGGREPEYADIKKLITTTACIKETMRLFPIVQSIPKYTTIGGYHIPAKVTDSCVNWTANTVQGKFIKLQKASFISILTIQEQCPW